MGNEGSSLSQKLGNDIKVVWKKSKSCQFQPREGQTCASVGGNLYIFGGVVCGSEDDGDESMTNQETNQLLMFNTDTATWKEVETSGQVPEPRSGSTIAAVGSQLFLFGGLSEFSGWLNDMYMFDTETKIWTQVTDDNDTFPPPRDKLSSVAIGRDIYYFGGFGPCLVQSNRIDEVILEDDGDEEFEDEDIQEVQQAQNAANFTWFNDIYKFDTVTKEWGKVTPQNTGGETGPTPRAAHTMCAVNQSLIVFGGRDSVGRQNDVWKFSLSNYQWEECDSMGYKPEPRSFHASVAVGHRIVICGGRSITNDHFEDFHIYDSETSQWFQPSITGDTPPGMGLHSLNVAKDKIILYGGTSNLDPVTNSCTQYYSDCYILNTDDVLTGGAVTPVEQKENIAEVKSEGEPMASKETSLPEFLNLKPADAT